MQVGDVMSSEIICISADATVFDAAEILVGAGISAAPVVDAKGIVVGIVSEADLMRRSEIGTQPHKSFLARMLANDSRSAAEYVAYHSRHVSDVMSREVI